MQALACPAVISEELAVKRQWHEGALADVARGLGPRIRGEHDVLVDHRGGVGGQFQLCLPQFPEIAHRGGRDRDGAIIAHVADLDPVVAVILDLKAERLGLEGHARILGDEHDRPLGGITQVKGGGDNAVVGGVHLHEDRPDPLGAGAVEVVADQRFIDDDTELAAVAQFRVQRTGALGVAFGDLLQRTVLEQRADRAVDPARAGAQLAGLRLKPIQLGENLDRNGDRVLVELKERLGVVNQYVGVQDVSLFHVHNCPRWDERSKP